MKNKDKWKPSHFSKDDNGRIIGTHMHKIIGHAYEKVIKKYASGVLADIGCGDVPYYLIYKDQVKDNICVDWSGSTEMSFLDSVSDLNEDPIPISSDAIDTVLCTDVLEHIKNPEQLFSEMARIMKSQGKMILTVPFMYWVHTAPHDFHRYTKYKLQDFCGRNGLRVLEIEEYGGLPEVLYDLIWKGYFYYNFPGKKVFLGIWKLLGTILYKMNIVKKITLRTKGEFPLGYILVAEKV